ncbi:MAG: efflux transporter outer membrane subunit [Verrucomicrobiota bacterium]
MGRRDGFRINRLRISRPVAVCCGLALAAATCTFLASCRTVGPDFKAPTMAESTAGAAFKHAAEVPALPSRATGEAWWTVFADPVLVELETAALAQSPSLAAAVARVEEARARIGLVRADNKLSVTASGTARLAGETAERTLPVPGQTITYRDRGDSYRTGVDASFELDLWGRVKRSLESAEAQVAATEADQRAVRLVLTAEVAQTYFTWRMIEGVAEVLGRTVASRREAVEVLKVRFDAGLSPELDVNRARVELATLESEIVDVRRRRDQAVNALAVLTGKAPAAFSILLTANPGALAKALPPAIPPGLPSELLRRRPDLAASEALLHARTAEIGVAEAAKFPSIRLTGGAGFESLELGSLLGRPSQFWQFGPSFSVPLLDGGRTQSNIAVAQARLAAAAADYQQRGLAAFREVEDALVDLREQAAQAAAQDRAAESAATVVQLATTRYERGFATYLEIVDAQRSTLQIERTRAELGGARYASTVRLIRALGGGWE